MQRIFSLLVLIGVSFLSAPSVSAQDCFKIKDGVITASTGEVLTVGYDQFGYNYQARIFNGTYDSSDRKLDGKYWGVAADYAADSLVMKWSDNWLSNQDCTGDAKLDRDGITNISKGWTTNHVEGDYLDGNGDSHHYTYSVKIVWVGPPSAPDPWASVRIWTQYTIIQEVYNDPDGGYHGVDRGRLAHPAGLGFYNK